MVAYCNDCRRYVNQHCEKCQGTYGVQVCEWYACGGRMVCPNCGGNDLSAKMKLVGDPYDYSKRKDRLPVKGGKGQDIQEKYFAEQRQKDETASRTGQAVTETGKNCRLCGYSLDGTWKFCPECGVSLLKR